MSEAAAVGATELEPEFLSVAQVARRLGCSVSLVQKWRRLGWLPATRLGPPDVPVYGYRPADVERFVSERWNRQRGRPSLGQGGAAGSAPGAATAPGEAPLDGTPAPLPGIEGAERFKPPRLEPVGEEGLSGPLPAQATADAPVAAAAPQVEIEAPPADAPADAPAAAQALAQAPESAPEPEPPAPPPPPPIKTTGRPLILWDGDPREGTAIVIARFPPTEAWPALNLATAWARRYNEVFLCEVPRPGGPPGVLAVWRRGERQPLP